MSTKISATVVADSVNIQGDRLTSVLVTMPRIIIAEMNTHRMLSKNTSSSRAIPFNKMVEAIQNDPFIPIAWQKEHKGMQGTEYWTEADKVNGYSKVASLQSSWLHARTAAVDRAKFLHSDGLTKQLCNRLLEPFMWTTMLITGSKESWNNFFELRNPVYEVICGTNGKNYYKSKRDLLQDFPDAPYETDLEWLQINKGQAEIHMMALAECIWDSVNESTPKQLKDGEWHIPMKNKIEINKLAQAVSPNKALIHSNTNITELQIKCSVAMAARTSYTVVGEEKEVNYENLIALHDRLLTQEPPHSSPFEHCARAMSDEEYNSFYKGYVPMNGSRDEEKSILGWCRNFKGFIQYRHLIENGQGL